MAKIKTYYEILGVAEDADEAALRRAYRRVVREFHPDLNPDNPRAAKRARELNAALETLTDSEKRKRYDAKLQRRRGATRPTPPTPPASSTSNRRSADDASHAEPPPFEPQRPNGSWEGDSAAGGSGYREADPGAFPELDPFEEPSSAPFAEPFEDGVPEDDQPVHGEYRPVPDEYQGAYDDYRPVSGDYRPQEVPPFQTQAGGGGAGYQPPRGRRTANHSMWLGFGLGATSILLLLVVVVIVILVGWGRQAWGPSIAKVVPRAPQVPSMEIRPGPASRPPPMMPFAPTANRSSVREVVDLVANAPRPDGKRESDFKYREGKFVSGPEGLQVLQFPGLRPVADYELVARVTRLSGDGHLVIGASSFGSPVGVKFDGYAQLGFLSGIETIRGRHLDQRGNDTAIVGRQLPMLKPVVIVIAVHSLMREVRITVDGREIGRYSLRPGFAQLEQEIDEYVSNHFFVATRDAEIRIDGLEMRKIDTTRRR